MMKVLNLFYTSTSNTQKVADSISSAAEALGHRVDTVRVTKDLDPESIDLLDYDFLFVGVGGLRVASGQAHDGIPDAAA